MAHDAEDGLAELAGAVGAEDLVAVVGVPEPDAWVSHGVACDDALDLGSLGGLGAEELEPGGLVAEEILDGDAGAETAAPAPVGRGWCSASPHLMWYCVAASSAAVQVTQVRTETAAIEGSASPRKPRVAMLRRSSAVRSFDVACPREGGGHLVGGDAGAVVLDPDGLVPPCSMETVTWGGTGVDGVFDEFLGDRGGAFDDFAGSDLGGDVGGEYFDLHVLPEAGVGGEKPRRSRGEAL